MYKCTIRGNQVVTNFMIKWTFLNEKSKKVVNTEGHAI
jgi:hypothetical protein